VEKFKELLTEKKPNGDFKKKSFGRGTLSIEKATINDKIIYVLVFRDTIQTRFTGKLDPVICKKRRIPEKATQNYIKLRFPALPKPGMPKTHKFDDVMISFSRSDDLIKFEEEFDKALTVLK
jgi:hypothetical protein